MRQSDTLNLNAIEARLAAVPGLPLVAHREGRDLGVWMDDHGDLRHVARCNDQHGDYTTLFASAPTDIAALVAEVKRLREQERRALPCGHPWTWGDADDAADCALCRERTRNDDEVKATRKLLRDARNMLILRGEEASYGGFHGGDPRDFHPDYECSTEEERAAHAAACVAFAEAEARGEKPVLGDTHQSAYDDDGRLIFHVAHNPYGLGTMVYRDEEMVGLAARIDDALPARGAVLDRPTAADDRTTREQEEDLDDD